MKPEPGTTSIGQEPTNHNIWKQGEFFKVNIRKTGATTARFRVKGRNNRSWRYETVGAYTKIRIIVDYQVRKVFESVNLCHRACKRQVGEVLEG